MNKKTLNLVIISLVLAVLIVIATAYLLVNSMYISSKQGTAENDEGISLSQAEESSVEKKQNNVLIKPRKADIIDYEAVYLEYVRNNAEYFSRGMILCDLNLDNIPELFSIAYDTAGDLVYYHELKDGNMIAPSDSTVKTYIDGEAFLKSTTFFEDVRNFIGIYKDKKTGFNALVNSITDYTTDTERFDIISFHDDELKLEDWSAHNGIISNKDRDAIMSGYELADERMYSSYLVRGEFGGEHGSDPVAALKSLIDEFKDGEAPEDYDNYSEGEFLCYIRNIDIADNEIELIPAAYISYQQYTDAMNSDRIVEFNNDSMSIQYDENLYEMLGVAYLYQMPFSEYQFTVPTPENPLSVIEDYRDNEPVKVKMSKNLKVRYGVLGGYNPDGTPDGYETLGRSDEYTIAEYYPHFAEYNMNSYYKAFVKDGKLEFIDVFYHE